jgi:NADH-quinone oxidoreductase subunit G
MANRVRIRVDGVDYEVEAGRTVLQALDDCGALRSEGSEAKEGAERAPVEIPHYCWHPKLSIDGSCRLCQVEVRSGEDGDFRLAIACNTPVADGLQVDTQSEAVARAREGVMELLLVNHPLDCPICDQSGECRLQDYAYAYGVDHARTREPRRKLKKRTPIGPTIVLDQERCILCRRCVRFCREVTGTGELGIFDRGDRSVVETFPGDVLDNAYSMNVADVCPVGALTTRDFRFKERAWSLQSFPGICTGCSRGCSIHVDVAKNEVQRYRPRRNDAVNGTWMCDEGRLSYHAIAREDRIAQCLVRTQPGPDAGDEEGELRPASLDEATRVVAARLRRLLDESGPGVIAGVASAHASNEDLRAFKTFLDVLDVDSIGLAVRHGDSDGLLVEAEKGANGEGARAIGFGDPGALLERVKGGGIQALLVLGHDLVAAGGPMESEQLAGLDTLVVFDTHRSALERVADVVFPVRHAAEKQDSYTNSAGIVQPVQQAVQPAAGVLDERDFLQHIGEALGLAGYGEAG